MVGAWPLAVASLTLLPVAVGLPATYFLNEWQVVAALAIGAAVGGALLAVGWMAGQNGRPLLDVLGPGGTAPIVVLWGMWPLPSG